MNQKFKGLIVGLLWCAWATAVLVPFFSINAPFFHPLCESMILVMQALWFWLLALGLGWRGFRLLQVWNGGLPHNLRESLICLILSCGFGLGLIAMFVLVVGSLIGVDFPTLLITHLILVVLVGTGWVELGNQFYRLVQLLTRRTWKPAEVAVALAIIGISCLQLPAALTPTLYPDTWRYHFGLTRLFEQLGYIAYIPDYAEANISSNWQMIYLPQLILCGDGCAQVFNWMTLPIIAIAAGLAAGPGTFAATALVLISTPFLLGVAGLGNNDLGVAFFAALMWLTLRHEESRRFFFLAGVFGGLAVGAKYPALTPVVATIIAFTLFSQGTFQNRWCTIAVCAGGVFTGYLPWFVRNILWTGDPFYPVLSRWLPWCGVEGGWVAEHYAREMAYYGSGLEGWRRILFAPWRMTVADPDYNFESDVGLLFWCAVPLVCWTILRVRSQPAQQAIRLTATATLIGGVIWAIGLQVTRFLGPLIPAAAMMIGISWQELSRSFLSGNQKLKFGLSLVAAIVLITMNIWQTLTSIAGFSDPYHFLLQGMSRDQYLIQQSPLYRIAQWTGQPERVQSKILLVGEEGVYFFRNPVRVSGPFDRKWIVNEIQASSSTRDLATRLKKSGIDFLCINEKRMNHLDKRFGYMDWPSESVRQHFTQFLAHETRLVRTEGNIRLYRIPE